MLSTRRRQVAWLAALLALAGVAGLTVSRELRLSVADEAVITALTVRQATADTLSLLKDAETGQRGFLLTRDESFLGPYAKARREIPQQLKHLKQLVANEPSQARVVYEVERLAGEKLDELAETVLLVRDGNADLAVNIVREGRGRRLMLALRAETQRLLSLQTDELRQKRDAAQSQRRHLHYVLYAAAALVLGMIGGGLWSSMKGNSDARQAAERLRKSEQALRLLADSASDLVRMTGKDGQLIYVSPSCQAILGYTQEEVFGMPPRALLPEEERGEAHRLITAARAGAPTDAPFVHRLLCKDGSFRWFETKYKLVQGMSDSGIQLTSRDITDRKRADDALRQQTERLESVLASMGDGVVVVDEHREFVLVNPVASRFIRQKPGEPIATDWAEQHGAFQIDGVTPFTSEQGPLTRALQGEILDGLELILHDNAGVPHAFSVNARPIQGGPSGGGCVAIYREITEQRRAQRDIVESEQRLRILSEASFEGVAITKAGVIVDTNAVFAAWFGRPPEDLIGEQGLSLFAPEDRDLVKQMSGESGRLYEARMLRPDGSRFPVEVRGREANFRGTKVRIAVIRDITERKRREGQLRTQAAQMKDVSLRDELTALLNRRGFVEHATQQLRSAIRNNKPSCLFFIDLNDMKGINDALGHDIGDRALIASATVIREVFRDSDITSRLGGDEFAVLAVDCGPADVLTLRQRLHARTAKLNRDTSETFRLSMSIGAAVFDPQTGTAGDLERLMELADKAMYAEKRASKAAKAS